MYSIGDIARLGGVSARMLRHYDEIGLFHPAAVDPNGYRRYHPAQLVRLHRIVALRDLGFGLDAIAELVGGDINAERLWGMLRLRQDELEAERAVLEGRLHRLSRHLVCGATLDDHGGAFVGGDGFVVVVASAWSSWRGLVVGLALVGGDFGDGGSCG